MTSIAVLMTAYLYMDAVHLYTLQIKAGTSQVAISMRTWAARPELYMSSASDSLKPVNHVAHEGRT